MKLRIRYWKKIIDISEGMLTKVAYEEESKSGKWNAWVQETRRLMIEVWLEEVWKQQGWEGTHEEGEERKDTVVKIWAEKQWNEKRKNMVKLRVYRRVKEEKGWTGYL